MNTPAAPRARAALEGTPREAAPGERRPQAPRPRTARASAGNPEALGLHLYALRRQRGWSQRALCGKAGISEVTIRAIERNYPVQATPGTLRILSRAFGLPDDYLQAYRDNPPPEETPAGPEAPAARDPAASPFDEKWVLDQVAALCAKVDRLEGKINAAVDALVMTLTRIREM